LFVSALANGEYARAIDFLFMICRTLPPVDTNEVKQRLVRRIMVWERLTNVKDFPYHEKSLAALMTEIVKILAEYRIWTDWAFMRIDRMTISLDASLATLAPTANYPAMFRDYFHSLSHRELERIVARENISEGVANLGVATDAFLRFAAAFPVLNEPMMRSTQIYRGEVNKGSYLAGVASRFMFWSTVLAEAFLILCFLLQHHQSSVSWILPLVGSGIVDLASRFPPLGYATWLATLLVVAAFARSWARVRRTLIRSPMG
jgi:hypothetical protein